jgi:hypothetical protein
MDALADIAANRPGDFAGFAKTADQDWGMTRGEFILANLKRPLPYSNFTDPKREGAFEFDFKELAKSLGLSK